MKLLFEYKFFLLKWYFTVIKVFTILLIEVTFVPIKAFTLLIKVPEIPKEDSVIISAVTPVAKPD